MKKIYQVTLFATLIAFGFACGEPKESTDKQAQLKKLKKEKSDMENQISALEKELIVSGELKKKEGNKVLISAFETQTSPFEHWVEIRGTVASKKNVMLTTEMMGRVEVISVKEGQKVNKGKVLIRLDDKIIKNSIAEVQVQLELAIEMFNRQRRLWEKKIGMEIQYLKAKTEKESLERKLITLNSELDMAYIKAPFDGMIDDIPVRVGEVVQPGNPAVRVLNPKEIYITSDVSEAFLGKFEKGQDVVVYFPFQDKKIESTITSIGQTIKSANRTFEIEINIPSVDFPVKPNQVVVLNLVDYTNEKAIVIPTGIIQKDSRGSYIFEIIEKDDQQVARKVHIETGVSYQQETEVRSGLKEGLWLADKGYRDLIENIAVLIAE